MYLARYELETCTWLQGSVELPHACSSGEDAWAQRLRAISGLFALDPEIRPSYRILVTPQSVRRILFASARLEAEAQLRRLLSSFTRLDVLIEDSADLPASREQHDQLVENFGRFRYLIVWPGY